MKILITATVQSHICQFHKPLIKMLHYYGCEVHVAARNNLAEKNGLKLDFVEKVYDVPFSRSPKSLDNIKAYHDICSIISENNYDIIHCNTPMGGIITRLAARKKRKNGTTKVYYTAHGFHFYQGAPLINWIIYYPIEKIFANLFTDKLILISDADYLTAQKHNFKVELHRIHSVGINTERFKCLSSDEVFAIRKQMQLPANAFIGICIGELNQNKNQKQLICAVPQILKVVPNFYLLIAGNGPEERNLRLLIKDLHLSDRVKLIGYRTDVERFVNASDLAISVSIREGLGINLIEAMTCGKVVIGSDNRGHRDFIKNEANGFIVGNKNFTYDISKIVKKLYENKKLYMTIADQAIIDARVFADVSVEKELKTIYFD